VLLIRVDQSNVADTGTTKSLFLFLYYIKFLAPGLGSFNMAAILVFTYIKVNLYRNLYIIMYYILMLSSVLDKIVLSQIIITVFIKYTPIKIINYIMPSWYSRKFNML